eukprot:gnl/TRDRNA2_/TRDRNA2_173026_c9_seq1.p1 gnl/TRDRNA2_/TRDRNA2_173026_c9~~gnl/TRDRNA2_/TRDRNA2_173026_c9_seq1.p1  ORF type:complete len:107 (+),score=25.46 gnl/TRDRNA2_/TRDRNA2_173026_c9_seq1:41-361(+)
MSDALLFGELAKAALPKVADFKAQNLANSAWAFATTNRSGSLLFKVLAAASWRHFDDFQQQDLSNTSWAFSTQGYLDESLFGVLARAVEHIVFNDFNAGQALANTT